MKNGKPTAKAGKAKPSGATEKPADRQHRLGIQAVREGIRYRPGWEPAKAHAERKN